MGGLLNYSVTLFLIAAFLYGAIVYGEKVTGWLFGQAWRVFDIQPTKPGSAVTLIGPPKPEEKVLNPAKNADVIEAVVEAPKAPVQLIEQKEVMKVVEPLKVESVAPQVEIEVAKPVEEGVSAAQYLQAITLMGVLADCGKDETKKTWAARNKTATGPGGDPQMVKDLADAFVTIWEFRKWKK